MSQPQRHTTLLRVLRLVRLLRYPQTLEGLAEVFGVSTRTIRRDIDVLREAGFHIWRSDEGGRLQVTNSFTDAARGIDRAARMVADVGCSVEGTR